MPKFGSDYKPKPGDVIRARDVVYLVGNINCLGGECDDCAAIGYEENVELLGNVRTSPQLIDLVTD